MKLIYRTVRLVFRAARHSFRLFIRGVKFIGKRSSTSRQRSREERKTKKSKAGIVTSEKEIVHQPFAKNISLQNTINSKLDRKSDVLCSQATVSGNVNGSGKHLVSQMEAAVDQEHSLVKEEVDLQLGVITSTLKGKSTEQSSFNLDSKSREFQYELEQEASNEKASLSGELEGLNVDYHLTEGAYNRASEHRKSAEAKYGKVEKKSLFDKSPIALIFTVGIVDFVIVMLAMIGLNMEPLLAIGLATGTSMSMCLCSHWLGKSIFEGHKGATVFWGICSLMLVGVLLAVRMVSEDPHAWLTAILFIVYYATSTGAIYQFFKRGVVWRAIDAEVIAEQNLKSTANRIGYLASYIPTIGLNTSADAHHSALDYKNTLDKEVEFADQNQAYWVNEGAAVDRFFASQKKGYVSKVEHAFEEANTTRYQPPKRSVLWKVSVLSMFLILFSCSSTEHHHIALMVDQSATMLNMEDEADQICQAVFDKCQLGESEIGQKSIDVYIYNVGSSSIPIVIHIQLELSDHILIRKTQTRKQAIEEFRVALFVALKEALGRPKLANQTQLHRNTAHAVSHLNSFVGDLELIVISDCIQDGGRVSFPAYKTADGLRANRQEIITLLLDDHSLESMKDIQVTLLAKSRLSKHSAECVTSGGVHTEDCVFGNDEFAYESALIFQELWLDSGANDVHVIRNY